MEDGTVKVDDTVGRLRRRPVPQGPGVAETPPERGRPSRTRGRPRKTPVPGRVAPLGRMSRFPPRRRS